MINIGFIILCTSAFIVSMGAGIISPILPIYSRDLGASGLMLGFIFSSFYASMALCNPIMGRLSDRIGKKVMISLGFGIGTIVAISYIWAANPMQLIIVRLIHGVVGAMVIPVVMALVGELSPVGKEGLYMGIYSMMCFLGIAAGPVVGGRIVDAGGTALAFYTFSGLTGMIFLLNLFFLPPTKALNPALTPKRPLKEMFASRPIKGLIVFNFILAIAQGALMVFLPLLARSQHLTITQIGILASVFISMAGLFQVPFGWLANRYDRVRLVIFGTLLVAFALAFLPMAVGFKPLLFLSAIIGISSAIASPAASAILVEHSRSIGMGFVMGSMNTVISLGMITGPIVAGIVMDQLSISYSFYICSIIFLAGAVLFNYFTKAIE